MCASFADGDEKLFDSLSSLEQLQGERALVVRALGHSSQVQNLLEREAMLLREHEVQQQQQQRGQATQSSKVFRVRLNNSFFYALSTCDKNIKVRLVESPPCSNFPFRIGLLRAWCVLRFFIMHGLNNHKQRVLMQRSRSNAASR
jgi:hypothetical protein